MRQDADPIRFSIQHPDLTSGLVAPSDALTAGLFEVSCSLDLSMIEFKEHIEDSPCLREGSNNVSVSCLASESHDDTLTTDDQRAIDEFMAGFRGNKRQKCKDTRRKPVKTKHSRPIEDIAAFHHIMETSIEILIRGEKRCPGIKMLEGTSWPGLIKLAPGVFHMDHLKVNPEVKVYHIRSC